MQSIDGNNIQIPVHKKVTIHCKLKEFIEVGDHFLYICNVEDVGENIRISDGDKDKIKEEIVTKINSVLEKNNESFRLDK
ncbi:hypothetical protein [Methanobrevibacter sp.]